MSTFFTFTNLYQAYIDCRRRKANTFYALKFSEHLEDNLLLLVQELQNRTYRPGRSIAFIVKKPKIREIFAADFRDRVVHHLLFNYLNPIFERIFIYDTFACRRSKGTHKAMKRLQYFTQQLPPNSYYLQMDIKSFFTSIDKQILYNLVVKKVKNEEILWLTRVIIWHDCVRDIPPKLQSPPELFASLPAEKSLFTIPSNRGLPIGNLTSQFFSFFYLNELDQFVIHTLKVHHYLRYVDDFIFPSDHINNLLTYQVATSKFVCSRLKMVIHPCKQIIRPTNNGINFVGYIVRSDYVLVRRRLINNWRRKNNQQSNYSYYAHAKWANSYSLMKRMLQ